MHFAFSDDQLLFRDTVRDLLAKEAPPEVLRSAWDSDTGAAGKTWSELAAMGVVGLRAPESAGGLAMTDLDLVLLQEEAGRAALPDPMVEHVAVAVPALEAGGDTAADTLTSAAAGEAIVSVALDNVATYAPFGGSASAFVAQQGASLYLVDGANTERTPQPSVDEARRLISLTFDAAQATELGGAELIATSVDRGALAAAAQLLGISGYLIDTTTEYAKERQQFGKPIGVHQAVKHQLADALVALEFARPLVYRAAYSLAHNDPEASAHVSMAKAQASDAAAVAARAGLQLHGAIGYTDEYDLQLWLKRAWTLGSAWGTAAWHRDRVGTALGI